MKIKPISFLTVLFTLNFSLSGFSQIVTTAVTPVQAVGNVLIGGGINASNVTYTGSLNAISQFTATNSNLPITSGLIISTGNATNPQLNGPVTTTVSTANGMPGNTILSSIAGVTTNDAAVLQFDFIPLGDTLKFDYVFASEEYNVYVGGGVNDVFAFLLSGPNPAGGNYVNANLALLPGTSTPVSINTVNNGSGFGCSGPCTGAFPYCNYFIDYQCGTLAGPLSINASTTKLTAFALVEPCQTYTIKLAIADGGDQILDSWVFLESNSFVSPQLLFESSPQLGGGLVGAVDTVLYEGCTNATVTIRRNFDLDSARTYTLGVSGTAVDGIDYSGVPTSVTFGPGDSTATFNLQALWNLANPNNTTLSLTITDSTVCGSQNSYVTGTINFLLYNVNPLVVDIGPDQATCNLVNILPTVTGGVPPYSYSWNGGLSTTPFILNYPLPNDMNFTLDVTDLCGNVASDTMFADLKNNPFAGLNIYNAGLTTANESCGNVRFGISRTTLTAQALSYPIYVGSGTASNGVDFTYDDWVHFAAGQSTDTLTFTAIYDLLPEGTEFVYLYMLDSLCDGSVIKDSIRIDIRNVDAVTVDAGADLSTGCPVLPQSLQAQAASGIEPYTYAWSTGDNTASISVQPAADTPYYVTVSDSCGRTASDTIVVTVFYPPTADFNFNSPDFCQPSTVLFQDASSTLFGNLNSWRYLDSNGVELSQIDDWSMLFPDAGFYPIQLIVGSDYPNCFDTVTKVVEIFPKPVANFWWTPNPITEVNPTGSFSNASSPDVSAWIYEVDNTSYNTPDFSHTFLLPGEYPIYLTVQNEYGCRDTVEKLVIVEGEHTFHIPNSFTPDNDGLNEFWGPKGENIEYLEYFIFNRWGEKIFEANSEMDSYLWDGKNKSGKVYKTDSYVYRMYVRDKYGKEYEYFGFINLMGGH